MKRVLLPVAVLLSSLLLSSARPAESSGSLAWRSWDAGLREAGASGRPILVDIYTDWCGWCRRMDADVYSRADVQDYLSRRFVTIKLDAESSRSAGYMGRTYTSRSLASAFGVTGYPTTVFLRPGGEHLVNVPGYVKSDRFLLLLRYISEGHLDRGVPFEDFRKSLTGSRPSKKSK
jgi:thioredoxin-related protein